ncbi:hypothetical protein [Streptomyces sp. NPDC006527]|uniref:hypothetical protein n=1 Tax=Streptomyces sp. NPDC006527 TaxID=3364749 RepID=UPI00368FACB9
MSVRAAPAARARSNGGPPAAYIDYDSGCTGGFTLLALLCLAAALAALLVPAGRRPRPSGPVAHPVPAAAPARVR